MKPYTIPPINIIYVASLAHLALTKDEENIFLPQVSSILGFISKLQEVPTKQIAETSQVTGLTTVLRDDEIDTERMFTQEQALKNAQSTYNGYIMVRAVFE